MRIRDVHADVHGEGPNVMQKYKRLALTGATALLAGGLGVGLVAPTATAGEGAGGKGTAATTAVSGYCGHYKGNKAVIARGSGNTKAVKEIQCLVNKRWKPVAGTVSVDGVFGAGTERAVKKIQKVGGKRAVDGVVGPTTWKHLRHGSWD
ncbi:peptidoglycan-binding domain-containing protein [Streptomyces sp. HNM0574]|uniref:peptidoglycan-binding domain-containing protein n=1 Tax=Streptomyces sp. HNM0574 TaxID=2714954 RepID=UPI00146ED531|nr:peptidoglycan-binding domain-containing protein [Streptomyces sp. HNM0574]NLU70988.1 peptidoglycan-binding protein [Streptomyces sp. HNM0574]